MTNRRYELGPMGATVTPESLWVGKQEVLWEDVLAAGLSYAYNGRYVGGSTPYLHFAYKDGKTDKRREGLLCLQASGETNRDFVNDVRSRIAADRWLGEAGFLKMRKRLGFSNRASHVVFAGSMLLLIAIFAIVMMRTHGSRPNTRQPATRQGAR